MSKLGLVMSLFSLVALTLGSAVHAGPAAAATGFHAAFAAESAFLTLSAGQSGQFAVGFTNTGDRPWVKGLVRNQANLATANPLGNTTDFTAGWANGWLSPNRYAAQQAAVVAPEQVGYFVYSITVPAGAPLGEHRFYGRPLIEGVTWLEDVGYYQSVTVVGGVVSRSTAITGVSPAGPSTNTRPTVSGTTGVAGCTVTVFDEGIAVGWGTTDASGSFAIRTDALAVGTHSLSASASCSDGFHASATSAPYTVLAGGDDHRRHHDDGHRDDHGHHHDDGHRDNHDDDGHERGHD